MIKKISAYVNFPMVILGLITGFVMVCTIVYAFDHRKPLKPSPAANFTPSDPLVQGAGTSISPVVYPDTSGILDVHLVFRKDGTPVARCNQFGSKCEFVNGATLDDVIASWKEIALADEAANTHMFHGWHSCENELQQRLGHDDYIVTQEAKDWLGTLRYVRVCDSNGSSQLCGSLK
jgi:hypothetical protein